MKWHFLYLMYFIKHKWFVFIACMKLGVPVIQALIHDLSKFTPSEWPIYVRYFHQRRAEFLAGKILYAKPDFDFAWNHHQKANKHHFQHWLLIADDSSIRPIPIPERYAREMVADWLGAGRAKTGSWDIQSWIQKNGPGMKFHLETAKLVGKILREELNMPLAAEVIEKCTYEIR